MITIYKYELEIADTKQRLSLPVGYKILSLQAQHGRPCLWVKVEPGRSTVPVVIQMYGTGQEMPAACGEYLGTVQIGPFVWHYYQEG